MYLVVQDKLERSLEAINAPKTQSGDQASRDNVTVKYHPLIADGIKTGVGGTTNKILKGDFILMDREQKVLRSRKMTVNAHDNLWSGPENDAQLRDVITTKVSNEGSIIISKLQTDSMETNFIDINNKGANEIITVHVLLNNLDFYTFQQDMITKEIVKHKDYLLQYTKENPDTIITTALMLYKNLINKQSVEKEEDF